MTDSDRIPIRMQPIHGESFDGWLDAYAQRLQIPPFELGEALGVPHAMLRMRGAKLPLPHHDPDPAVIAARACGLEPAQVEALWLGLTRYSRLVAEGLGRIWLGRATRPLAWSRFCPTCLRESGGRWFAAWRLPWYLACPTHKTMLASMCSSCGGSQRAEVLRLAHLDRLTTLCDRPRDHATGRGDHRCRYDLTLDAPTAVAPPRLLSFQSEIVTVLDPALTDTEAGEVVNRLIDVLVVATHVGLDPRAIDLDRLNTTSVLAAPLVEAHCVLAEPQGPRLRALANTDRQPMPEPLPGAWRAATPPLVAALLAHRDGRLSAPDRLRFRSMTGAGRRPEGAEPSVRLRAMPLALWPDWAIRLRPTGIESSSFRISAAAALCLPGASAKQRDITALWSTASFKLNLGRFGRIVTADPRGTAILCALCELTDELDTEGSPIDYERRRALAAEIMLLDAEAWGSMCRAGHTPTGTTARLSQARLSLWQTLTGGLPEQAPLTLRMGSSGELWRYHQFAFRVSAGTAQELLRHARRLLDAHGCHDEPLTWSPIGRAVAVDGLPVVDPDAIDPTAAHMLLAQGVAPSDIAQQLGITLDHLRHVVQVHPPDSPLGNDPAATPRNHLAAIVTPAELRGLVDAGNTVKAIAARYGVSHSTVSRELSANGIPIPQHGPRPFALDREWLREQYIVKGRTMGSIAGETGASDGIISRLLHEYEIPIRPRGQRRLTAGDGYPKPLSQAVVGQGGTDRVRRFQVYSCAPSLNAAAKRIGVDSSTLTTQLARLETACGGALLGTLRDRRRHGLTALGRNLADQADQHLGLHSDAYPQLPEPLATAFAATHAADKTIAKFVVAASCSSLRDAALALDVHPYGLQRTIRAFGRGIGEPVVTDDRVWAPLRLTPIGRRLLRQAEQHRDVVMPTAKTFGP